MHLANRQTTVTILDQQALTNLAIRFGASWIEDLTEEHDQQDVPNETETLEREERFKFAVLIDEQEARATLYAITLNSDGTATGTVYATVLHSPILGYRYTIALSCNRGMWSARVEDKIRIDND